MGLLDGISSSYNVLVKFGLDNAAFLKGIKQVEASAKRIGANLTKSLTLPIIGLGAATINASLKMNKGMANIATLIPGATERVKELKTGIREMSVEMGIAVEDMVGGTYQIISAFGDNAETMARLEINANLAKAGLTSVTEAINLVSAVTKGYGDTSAVAMQHVSDLSMAVVRLGQTTLPELAASIGGVVPLAAAMNVQVEELFAGFATLTGVTGSAAEVATQYEGMLSALIKPSKEMLKAIEDLGFASAEAMVEQLGLVGSFKALIDATDGSLVSIGKLITRKEGLTAVLALTGKQADTFSDKLKEMGSVAGETAGAVKEQTEGINAAGFAWDQFKAKLKDVAIGLGDELIPAFTKLLNDLLIPFLTKVAEWVKGFTELDPVMQKIILGIVALTAAIGPLITGVVILFGHIKALVLFLMTKAGVWTLIAVLIAKMALDVVNAARKYDELFRAIKETNKEIKKGQKVIADYRAEAREVATAIGDLSKNLEDTEGSFDKAKKALVEYMDKYPDLRKELGYTLTDTGDLIDANGIVMGTYEDLQGVVDEFNMHNIRQQIIETTAVVYEQFKEVVDLYNESRTIAEAFYGWASGDRKKLEKQLNEFTELYTSWQARHVASLAKEGIDVTGMLLTNLEKARIYAEGKGAKELAEIVNALYEGGVRGVPGEWFDKEGKFTKDFLEWLNYASGFSREMYREIQSVVLPKARKKDTTIPDVLDDVTDSAKKAEKAIKDTAKSYDNLVEEANDLEPELRRQLKLLEEHKRLGLATEIEAATQKVSLLRQGVTRLLDLASQLDREGMGEFAGRLREMSASWQIQLNGAQAYLDTILTLNAEELKALNLKNQAEGRIAKTAKDIEAIETKRVLGLLTNYQALTEKISAYGSELDALIGLYGEIKDVDSDYAKGLLATIGTVKDLLDTLSDFEKAETKRIEKQKKEFLEYDPMGDFAFKVREKYPSEEDKEKDKDVRGIFDSLNDALVEGAAELGRSITGGDIAGALQNVFQMLGDAIAEDISTYIAAQIPGLGGGIFGALAGGLIGGLFSSIFGGGGGRTEAGMTESNPIFANITNWDQFFQFGMTLPSSWILSGRSRDFDLDPHGRTVDGLRDERRTDMHYNH